MTTTTVDAAIERAARVLREQGAREVYLFGSAAEGRLRDGSDIDLAVTGLPPERFFEAMGLAADVLDRPLSLVDLDEDTPFTRYLRTAGDLRLWDKLTAQVNVELEQLDELLATYRRLLKRCETSAPDEIELAALAAMLHSLYNGVENLLKRIAVEAGEGLPSGEVWHRRLLDQMAEASEVRPAVLSEELRTRLRLYLDFRHVFRHSYTFDLRWDKMRPLVLYCEETVAALRESLETFLKEGRGG